MANQPVMIQAMQSPKLSGVRAKIGRAEHHFDNVNTAIRSALNPPEGDNGTLFAPSQFDKERETLIVGLPKLNPLHPATSLMVGDCIHNLRSALDHLVYQLAIQNGSSAAAADKTFFPIALTKLGPKGFDELARRRVKPYISPEALTRIEKCQPYAGYDEPEIADILVLSKLDIIDKHRLLVVVTKQFMATGFTVTTSDGQRFKEIIPRPKWRPMEDGAEVLRFDFSDAPERPSEVQVQVDASAQVQFADTAICDGIPVLSSLDQLLFLVGDIVDEFGKSFFGE